MTSNRRAWAPRLARKIGRAVLAGAAIYAFSPAIQNQFGSVKPETQRARADNFTVQILNGGKWSLSEQRGKVLLVNFWARVESLPMSILIDKSGRIARTYAGLVTVSGLGDDIEAVLSEREGGA